MRKLVVCILLAGSAAFAHAQALGEPANPQLTGFADADAELNNVYRALMARISSQDQRALRRSQRAWLSFRDAECAFRSSPRINVRNAYQMSETGCMDSVTRGRTRQLQAVLETR